MKALSCALVLAGLAAGCGELVPSDPPTASPSLTSGSAATDAAIATAADAVGATAADAGATVGAGSAAAPFALSTGLPFFADAFGRPDSSELGGAWAPKLPSVFALEGGHARAVAYGPEYNGLALQPEEALDVEISALVTLALGDGYTRLYARAQASTDVKDRIAAYVLTVGPTAIDVGLYLRTGALTAIGTAGGSRVIPVALRLGVAYRIALRVRGSDPVELEGAVLDADGKVLATTSTRDASMHRIVSPGRVGFGGGMVGNTWDDFRRVDL